MARDVILIVGMGRSGTSALTRVLSLCGAALPLRVLAANDGNPRGYWEPQRALELNDFYLRAHASSWYDPSLRLQTQPFSAAERRDFVAQIVALLEAGFEADGPIVLKEPRITALLPYWIAATYELGLSAKVIHVFRNHADVASSLAHRDGLPGDQSLALWLKYNLVAERDARNLPRVFVSYAELLRDWEWVVARCIGELGVELAVPAASRSAVAEFLSPDLHHHRAAELDSSSADPAVTGWLEKTRSALERASEGAFRAADFDTVFAQYVASGHAERFASGFERELSRAAGCVGRPGPAS